MLTNAQKGTILKIEKLKFTMTIYLSPSFQGRQCMTHRIHPSEDLTQSLVKEKIRIRGAKTLVKDDQSLPTRHYN